MSITQLNIGAVPPAPSKSNAAPCPKCGAPAKKRMQDGGFGPDAKKTICGVCAYEFPELTNA